MARARNIKPGIFSNDVLAEVHPLGRLLFIGLWTHADREGRMEDRPRRIKAEILPYDDCDVDSLLSDLDRLGFIKRYVVRGERYIQVVNFTKHQNPHVKESASSIPPYVEPSTSTVQEQCNAQPIPERAGLIPDSGFLIPDSGYLNPDAPGSAPETPQASAAQNPSSAAKPKPRAKASPKTTIPADFQISEAVRAWAAEQGHAQHLQTHFEYFVGAALAKGYSYANWDQALMNAIRANWAKVGDRGVARPLLHQSFTQQRVQAEIDDFVNGPTSRDNNVIEGEFRRVGF